MSFEIGVFCDRTQLADTFLFARKYIISNFYGTESFLLVSVPKIAHLSANVNPVLHKKIRYIDAPDFSSISLYIRELFRNLARN